MSNNNIKNKCIYCEEKPNEPGYFDCVGLGACYSCLDCRKSNFLYCVNCGMFIMKGDKIINDRTGCKHNWEEESDEEESEEEENVIGICWTCDKRKATHKEYRDALGEYELTCNECHREEYPEQYK